MSSLDSGFLFDDNVTYTKRYVLNMVKEKEFELFKQNWSQELNNLNRANGGQSRLRSYRLFKSEYQSEKYLTVNLPDHHRSALGAGYYLSAGGGGGWAIFW